MSDAPGFSGSVAKKFLQTEITPLLAVLGLLLGVFAILVTPREEEPQIDVTFANVFIPFPGASAREVEQLVTTSAEQVLSEIEGVKHIYSVSRPGLSILTVEFEVGEARTHHCTSVRAATASSSVAAPTPSASTSSRWSSPRASMMSLLLR